MYRRLLPLLLLLFAGLAFLPLSAQTAPTTTPTDGARQQQLQQLLALDEPGEQMRGLEAFARQFPQAPELAQVYNAVIQDADQLNDDHTVLLYNEKLEALDPTDLGQRIKTLNLLLLETDPADQKLAATKAKTFADMVEAKAAEPAPADMGPARWQLNLARLRSVAALMEGTAEQALGNYAAAETDLVRSLNQGQTAEAAEHLAVVYVADGKIPQALDMYELALALPGDTIAGRAKLEAKAQDLYKETHNGSTAGLGDAILNRFDQVAARDAEDQRLLAPNTAVNATATTAQQFTLTSLDGHKHTLGDLDGKTVVVEFWATWCGPCLVQHPIITALQQHFAANPAIAFVAINEDEDPTKVAPFVTSHAWAPTTWLDAGLGGFLGVENLPTVMIFGPDGRAVYRMEGFVPDTFQTQLQQAIEGELARASTSAR